MEIIKCNKCNKCFMIIGKQEICPFCGEPLNDIPDFFKDIFKEK